MTAHLLEALYRRLRTMAQDKAVEPGGVDIIACKLMPTVKRPVAPVQMVTAVRAKGQVAAVDWVKAVVAAVVRVKVVSVKGSRQ
jgi:hypothetical protein